MNKAYIIVLSFFSIGTLIMAQDTLPSNMHHTRGSSFATTEPGIHRSYALNEFRICATDLTPEALTAYLKQLANELGLTAHDEKQSIFVFANENAADNEWNLEGIFVGKHGGIRAYYWHKTRLLTVDIQTHSKSALPSIAALTKQHFGLIEATELSLEPENVKQENSKVAVRDDQELGRGVFAKEDIKKGEFIGGLYGAFHEAQNCMSLPEECRDHVMQNAEHYWRGNETPQEAVQYLNHSCDPNTGVQGLYDFVAMRDIKAGEQLTTDYAMQDDSNWVVPGGECLCGAESCRGDILPYRNLPQEEKNRYNDYISHWIKHRYAICSCKD